MPDDDALRALLCDAARFAATRTEVGPSDVQRRVRVGFATAARLVHLLEDAGILGPPTAKGRYLVTAGAAELDEFITARGGERKDKASG